MVIYSGKNMCMNMYVRINLYTYVYTNTHMSSFFPSSLLSSFSFHCQKRPTDVWGLESPRSGLNSLKATDVVTFVGRVTRLHLIQMFWHRGVKYPL